MLKPSIGLALLLLSQGLFACSGQELKNFLNSDGSAIAGEGDAIAYAPGHQQYGLDGTLNADELLQVMYLAWPQTRQAMTNSFGFPAHFTESADYYAIEDNDNSWVVISYDGKTATGFKLEERQ